MKSRRIESFHNIFNAYLPNEITLPGPMAKKCLDCSNLESCRGKYLNLVETDLKRIIKRRDYDEIQQLKEVIDEIIKKRSNNGGIIDPHDVKNDLEMKEKQLQRLIRSIFSKVRRWSKVTTMASIPVALASITPGSPLFTFSGASLAGMSQLSIAATDLLSSKYSWVTFRNKHAVLKHDN